MKQMNTFLRDKIEQKVVWLSPKLCKCRSIKKWKRNYLHLQYPILPGEQYAGRILMDAEGGNEIISRLISIGGGYCIGKLGDVELFNSIDYAIKKIPGNLNKWRLKNNAGFFTCTENDTDYIKFCELYIQAVNSMDLIGVWFMPGEDYIIENYSPESRIAKLRCLEPYFYARPWSSALAGKKVLVVSPFAEQIKMQYGKRNVLFDNPLVLPDFELKTFKAVQTIGEMKDDRFKTWFEALYYMQDEISKIDFEVALIGCGAYSLPLASYIKSLGRGAIHTGGTTQIMFGIRGKRWDTMSDIAHFYNESWVRPEQGPDFNKATTATGDYW